MQYIFIYGKNPDLSLAEIVSYLEKRVKFEIKDCSRAFVLIEAELPKNIIKDLGGTIKIAQVIYAGRKEDLPKEDFTKLLENIEEKSTFGVSSYSSREEYEYLPEFFKKKMKELNLKVGYVHIPEDRSALTHVEVINKHLIERSFELIACRGKKFYLAKTVYVHNPFEFQKRDIERPEQRAIFAISPRLSKIMINLSKAEGVLLDPFCGIGSILQEALLMGLDIRGVDIDESCVRRCRENMKWIQGEYGVDIGDIDSKIIQGDARNLTTHLQSVDAIVTEPYLGPPLRDNPTEKLAKLIFDELGPLYDESIASMCKLLTKGKRIVIIAPCFDVGNKSISLDIAAIAKKNSLFIIDPLVRYKVPHSFPFIDAEERHKTIREIVILEKQ